MQRRFFLFALFIVSFFLIILVRLVYLQWIRGAEYSNFSDTYTAREVPIRAPRGIIYDRNGKVLASNRPAFNLWLTPSKAANVSQLLSELSSVTGFDLENVQTKLADSKSSHPILLALDLTRDQTASIQTRLSLASLNADPNWQALDIRTEPLRDYPEGEAFGHVLGYVREISEEKLKEMNVQHPGKYLAGDEWGVQGIERSFDLDLRGVDGHQTLILDASGRELSKNLLGVPKENLQNPSIPGKNLRLTLDAEIQKTAYAALGDLTGSAVVLDARNGEVLALVSRPSYDPQKLVGNVSKSYWAMLNSHEERPLLHRAIQAAYPPGSTFKIVTAIAALAEGVVGVDEKLNCPGYYPAAGRNFGCWLRKGHGAVNFYRALVSSCDVYFYKVGERLGFDRVAAYAERLGLGSPTGIELEYERAGLIPSTDWKLKEKKQSWGIGDTLSASIGQGFDLVTPLQNAVMMARVASEGKKIMPHLILGIEKPQTGSHSEKEDEALSKMSRTDPGTIDLTLDESRRKALIQALEGVVKDPSGTAHKIALKGISIGGKTGTAQVVNFDKHGRVAKTRKAQDHAWFVAFAPVENPQIALAVVVEHGGHGGAMAAPVAQAIIAKYFELNPLVLEK